MNPEDIRKQDIRKLLGGYAAGTLTPEEQQALFAAALEDQDLFDELVREQSLRDLLRDPAARAELLSALDTPDTPSRVMSGFWQWLRRPAVAGLATACVLTIAVVAVWRGTRTAPLKPAAPTIIAELKLTDQQAVRMPAPPPPPPSSPPRRQSGQQGLSQKFKDAEAAAPDTVQDTVKSLDKMAEAPSTLRKELRAEQDAVAPAVAPVPSPQPATPSVMARNAEGRTSQSVEVQAQAVAIGGVPESIPLDARALFYLNQLPSGASGFMEPAPKGGGGAAPSNRQAPTRTDAPAPAKSTTGLAAPMLASAAPPRLGVRVSILRGDREVDLGTALDPGETVRLKLIPNIDGFLSVAEGTRTLSSGQAQRLKPFETPELRFEGTGQRQLVVTLSRTPIPGEPLSIGALGRGNVVAPAADQGHATYVVTGAPSRQVVVPVTLTYR